MVVTPSELGGVCAMLPAFTTPDGDRVDATQTIDVAALQDAVDRMIRDGADMIATGGSFGEFHTLLWEEQQVLIEATVQAVRQRVPLFVGYTALHTREVLQKMRWIAQSGADGVLAGVPFYYEATVQNAVQFYHDLAEAFPSLGIMVYHNPPMHKVTLPVAAVLEIAKPRNVVAIKDSHREPLAMIRQIEGLAGQMSVFVHQTQMYPHAMLGVAGCWSIYAWCGPEPVLRLRDACRAGDWELAKQICLDIQAATTDPTATDLKWRENTHKLAINAAGYCHAGPLRPPFRHVPPELHERAQRRAQAWRALVAKYRPAPVGA
jgi:dihydrodipicolinate synthase/N-acetylneuraminate lyase